jgi:hypothetical protein
MSLPPPVREALRLSRDRLFFLLHRRAVNYEWRLRHRKVFALHPEYRKPCPPQLEADHRRLWKPLDPRFPLDTLRICYHLAGHADPRTVPEETFAALVERCLNPPDWPFWLSHKSLLYKLLPADLFPEPHLHNIGGAFFDADLRPISRSSLPSLARSLPYPVVLKPNWDSSGGRGVVFLTNPEELLEAIRTRSDFLVQSFLTQHHFFRAFHDHGVNTLRVYTYKSVQDDRVHVLNTALRMGVAGSLDNLTAGGIVCFIHPDGRMHHYACERYGQKFELHPDSRLPFGPATRIPDFDHLLELTRELAARLPMIRLAGWDMAMDAEGRWRCIEVNLHGHSIRFAQYAGQPFFGAFTDEVIAYCLSHPRRQRASLRIY